MEPQDPIQQSKETAYSNAATTNAVSLADVDIDKCIQRAHSERARYISVQGNSIWQAFSALWRRPRMVPTSYKAKGSEIGPSHAVG
jgi:hypothetical protein